MSTPIKTTKATADEFYLLLSVVVIGLSFLMSPPKPGGGLVSLFGFPIPRVCHSEEILGFPCPACGLTRGFIVCARGRFSEALSYNVLSPFLFFFLLVQIPWRIYNLYLRGLKNNPSPQEQIPGKME